MVVGPSKAAEHSWHACRATLASSLGANKEASDIIQVMCRWRAAESVREYNHMTPDMYADKVAAAMATDASQAPKGQRPVITDDDEAMAVLQAEVEALSATGTTAQDARTTRATSAQGQHEAATPQPAVYRTLVKAPAKNEIILVPASIYPTEPCNENDGQGWLARVVSSNGAAVRLCFETACTSHNLPYENVRLEWQHLQRDVTA